MEKKLLKKLVDLYIFLPGASIEGSNKIESSTPFLFSNEMLLLLKDIVWLCPAIENNIEVGIDFSYISSINELKEMVGENVESFSISFSFRNDLVPAIYFYKDVKGLIADSSRKLSTEFMLPSCYYLIDDKYISTESPVHNDILNIENLLEWFSLFNDVANFSNKRDGFNELVFIVKAEGDKVTKPTHFYTLITPDIADVKNIPKLEHFSDLKTTGTSEDLHIREKRQFFSMAIVEMLRTANGVNEKSAFWMSKNIDGIRNLYYEYYELFIENFAINKFRREIEETRFSYVEKIESVIGDIQGKLYVIPASFVAMGGLNKLDSLFAAILALIGIILGSVFTFSMVQNQKHRVKFLEKSLDFVFEKYKRQSEDEREVASLTSTIDDAKGSLVKMLEGKRKQIFWYSITAVLPLFFSFLVLYLKYRDYMFTSFVDILL